MSAIKLIGLGLLLFSLTKDQAHSTYKDLGKDIQPLTLSGGKYDESFDEDSVVQIGTVLFNTNTGKIVAFVEQDTLRSEATLEPQIVSKWLSPDPLAAKYPFSSPYVFTNNNPILLIDRDGREIFIYYTDDNGKTQAFQYKPGIKPVNNEFVQKNVAALNDINEVGKEDFSKITPNQIITQLSSTKSVNVYINGKAGVGDGISTSGTNKDITVTWNADLGTNLVDNSGKPTGGRQSPMTILAHEFGHVWNIASDIADYNLQTKPNNTEYTNPEEKRVINGIEKDVATYYNEGLRQNHYGGADFKARSSTSNEEALPTVEQNPGAKEI